MSHTWCREFAWMHDFRHLCTGRHIWGRWGGAAAGRTWSPSCSGPRTRRQSRASSAHWTVSPRSAPAGALSHLAIYISQLYHSRWCVRPRASIRLNWLASASPCMGRGDRLCYSMLQWPVNSCQGFHADLSRQAALRRVPWGTRGMTVHRTWEMSMKSLSTRYFLTSSAILTACPMLPQDLSGHADKILQVVMREVICMA